MTNPGGLPSWQELQDSRPAAPPPPVPPELYQVQPETAWGLQPQVTGPQQVASFPGQAQPGISALPRVAPGSPRHIWTPAGIQPPCPASPPLSQPIIPPSITPTFLSPSLGFSLWLPSLSASVSLPLSVCLSFSLCLLVSLFLPPAALLLLSSPTLGSPSPSPKDQQQQW